MLLPCDHLPLEIQPNEAPKQQKRMAEAPAENAYQDDDEEECVYFYQPVVEHQVPIADRTSGHDTQRHSYQETPSLHTEEPEPNTNEAEMHQGDVVLEEENQWDDEPLEDAQDEVPMSPYSNSGEHERQEQRRDLPRRERRPPKILTYDRLGTPACYSVAHTDRVPCQYQSLPYREV